MRRVLGTWRTGIRHDELLTRRAVWCVRFVSRTCEPVRRQKDLFLEWLSMSAHLCWEWFVLVVKCDGVGVAIKSWEGKAVDSNLPWHMPGQSLACAVAVCLASVARSEHRRHTCTSRLGSLARRPWKGGAPTCKNLPNFWDLPRLSQAHQPPPHIEPASTCRAQRPMKHGSMHCWDVLAGYRAKTHLQWRLGHASQAGNGGWPEQTEMPFPSHLDDGDVDHI